MIRMTVLLATFCLAACSHTPNNKIPYRGLSSLEEHKPSQPANVPYLEKITNFEEFKSIAIASKGVIRNGYTIKFIIDKTVPTPKVYFLNPNHLPETHGACDESASKRSGTSHPDFGKCLVPNFKYTGSSEAFKNNFYYSSELNERDYYGGRIQSAELKVDGVNKVVLGARFIERDLINEEMIQFVMEHLKKAMTTDEELAFVINSQNHTVEEVREWFTQNNVGIYAMKDLVSNSPFIALNPGEAYGFLNYFPEDPDDLEPYDIAVFDQIPLDLAVVAGSITKSFQDVGSHVNLKSKERGTPNMVLQDENEHEKLKAFNGQPVHLKVDYGGYTITPSTKEKVMAAYEAKINIPWQQPAYEAYDKMDSFLEICPHLPSGLSFGSSSDVKKIRKSLSGCLDKARQFGGKVAGMSFLGHNYVVGLGSSLQKKMGYRLTPLGFGVPLKSYKEFVDFNKNKNPLFAQKLAQLIDSETKQNGLSPLPTAQKKQLVKEVRDLFLSAEIPTAMYSKLLAGVEALKADVQKHYPGVKLKTVKARSSANTEDIKGFNGAGLHDSFSFKIKESSVPHIVECKIVQKLDEETGLMEDKVHPKSLACAVKAVYASLWSLRAVRERSFRRFDHRTATMGLSMQPTYAFRKNIDIAANSVLITRVVGTTSVYGQQLSTQVGNGLVTNPTPNTRAELVNITFQSDETNFGINVIQNAKPKADQPALSSTVMPSEVILKHSDIARTVEKAYCEARYGKYFYRLSSSSPTGTKPRACKFVTNSTSKPNALDMEFKYFDNGEVLIKQVRTFSGK